MSQNVRQLEEVRAYDDTGDASISIEKWSDGTVLVRVRENDQDSPVYVEFKSASAFNAWVERATRAWRLG